jgi:hypothetical protein
MTFITEELRAAIGAPLYTVVSHPIDPSDIRRWAIAIYWPSPPPPEWGPDADAATLVAPEEFNPFAWSVRSCEPMRATELPLEDSHRIEKLAGIPGPAVRNLLHGGYTTAYGVPMRVGDVVTNRVRLTGYTEREGSLGTMLFTATEELWTNQRDEQVKKCSVTTIRY